MKTPIHEAIAKLCNARVTPGFDGVPPIHAAGAYDGDKPGVRGRARAFEHPLSAMLARGQIEHDLWVAGVRFRADWELSHCKGERTVNWTRLMNAAPNEKTRMPRPADAVRGAEVGHGGPRGSKAPFTYTEAMPRIADAQATLDRLARRMSRTGFALLAAVCGRGLGIGEIARAIGDDRDYLGRRFREALDEAREFYNETIDARERGG